MRPKPDARRVGVAGGDERRGRRCGVAALVEDAADQSGRRGEREDGECEEDAVAHVCVGVEWAGQGPSSDGPCRRPSRYFVAFELA